MNRSGLYYHPVGPSAEEVQIKHRIDAIYTDLPFYGSRRLTAQLQREGLSVNRKRIQGYMREMGIEGIHPGPNLSRRQTDQAKFPYLLRHLVVTHPNHVWGSDITYLRLHGGWLYLMVVLDWYSRYVISWTLSDTLEQPFVMEAAQQALGSATPEIWNTDQGSHFTSPQWIGLLQPAGVQISMDGKGRALDNIFTERLWRTVKYEEVYLHDYAHPREARQQLAAYFAFYNHRRLHQALDYRTPAEVYRSQT